MFHSELFKTFRIDKFFKFIDFLEKLTLECRELFEFPTASAYVKSTLLDLINKDIEQALNIIYEVKDNRFQKINKMILDALLSVGLYQFSLFQKLISKSFANINLVDEASEKILSDLLNLLTVKLEIYKSKTYAPDGEIKLLEGYIHLEMGDYAAAAELFAKAITTVNLLADQSVISLARFEIGNMLFAGTVKMQQEKFSIPAYLESKRKRAAVALIYLENNELSDAIKLRNQAVNLINGIDELKVANQAEAKLTEQGLAYYNDIVTSVTADDSHKLSLAAQNSIEIRESTEGLHQKVKFLEQQNKQQNEVNNLFTHKVEHLEATINKQSHQLESVVQQNQQLLSMMQQMMQHMQNLPNSTLQQSQSHSANRYSFHNQPTAVNNVSVAQSNANSVGNETEVSNDSQAEHTHEQQLLNNII